MAHKQIKIQDPDLAKVGVALARAAAKARQLGFETNTPVYVFRDGKIIDLVKESRAKRVPTKPKTIKTQKKKIPSRGTARSRVSK